MFPSLSTMKTMLARLRCCSWLTTKSKKGHKQVIEKGKERMKGIGRTRRELLIALYDCLWNVAHENWVNRGKKEAVYCQIDAQVSEKYGITRDYVKSKWKILRSQIMREQALKQSPPRLLRKSVYYTAHALYATEAAKHLVCFPLV